jgi:hypothetical protein
MKPSKKTQKRKPTKKTTKTNRRKTVRRGGSIGHGEVDVYLIAYPRHRNDKRRVMYYAQSVHEDPKDFFNVDFIEDLMETMVKSKEPLVTYHKKLKIKEKED